MIKDSNIIRSIEMDIFEFPVQLNILIDVIRIKLHSKGYTSIHDWLQGNSQYQYYDRKSKRQFYSIVLNCCQYEVSIGMNKSKDKIWQYSLFIHSPSVALCSYMQVNILDHLDYLLVNEVEYAFDFCCQDTYLAYQMFMFIDRINHLSHQKKLFLLHYETSSYRANKRNSRRQKTECIYQRKEDDTICRMEIVLKNKFFTKHGINQSNPSLVFEISPISALDQINFKQFRFDTIPIGIWDTGIPMSEANIITDKARDILTHEGWNKAYSFLKSKLNRIWRDRYTEEHEFKELFLDILSNNQNV